MTLYLNNSGHRWVNIVGPRGERDKATVWFPNLSKTKRLAVKYWEAIGNFGVPYVRHCGKLIQLCPSNKKEGVWVENNEENRKENN